MSRSRGLLPFLALALYRTAKAAPPLVIFGDSLSDQGNRALQFENAGFKLPAFYYKSSRWSNGPTWSDYFDERETDATDSAVEKRVVANYAFGSAEACKRGKPADENDGIEPHPNLSDEIQTFLSGQPPPRLNGTSSGPWTDLGGAGPIDFAIFIGGNDIFARLLALSDPSFGDFFELLSDFEDDIIKCIVAGVEELLAGLPRQQVRTVMVSGLTAVSTVPALNGGLIKDGAGLIVENAREDFNHKLPNELGKVSVRNDTTLVYLDLFQIGKDGKEMAKNDEAPLRSVEELEDKCLETNFPTVRVNPTSNVDPDNLDACNNHFFYDEAHPTGPVHHYFAQQITKAFANPEGNKYTSSAAHGLSDFFSLLALLLSTGLACLIVGV